MTETPKGDEVVVLPPSLVWLKWLVIVLTLSLIGGVLTVVWLLVTRLPMPGQLQGQHPAVPEALELPSGATPAAVTMGSGWVGVVTTDDRILIFGADGKFWQEIAVKKPAP